MKTKRQKLIDKLDEVFGNYIRYRDKGRCITCGKVFDPSQRDEFHAGHLISRGKHSTRWDERNVYGQCRTCNGQQNWESDNAWMLYCLQREGRLTMSEFEVVRMLSRQQHNVKNDWFETMIEYYKNKLEQEKDNFKNNI